MDEIRNVSLDDVKDILNIYSYYIKNTAITFEINVPKEEDFKLRIKEISNNYPYIVLKSFFIEITLKPSFFQVSPSFVFFSVFP